MCCAVAFAVSVLAIKVLGLHVFAHEQLLIVKTFSVAPEAAPWQVELGQGVFFCFCKCYCAQKSSNLVSRLSSLDHVLHKYQRHEFLAPAGRHFYTRVVHDVVRNSTLVILG
jgi:hypothetical protein